MTREQANAYLCVIMMNKDMIIRESNMIIQKTIIKMSQRLFTELGVQTGMFVRDGLSGARVCGTEVSVDMQLTGLSYQIYTSCGIGILEGLTPEGADI